MGRALAQAEREGMVSPQEVHQLQAEASGALTAHPGLRRTLIVWGELFSAAEQFNRRLSFIAAYQTAAEQGIDNPAAFAAKAVDETQGVSARGRQPGRECGFQIRVNMSVAQEVGDTLVADGHPDDTARIRDRIPDRSPVPVAPHCGDNVCNPALEDYELCPTDCQPPPRP